VPYDTKAFREAAGRLRKPEFARRVRDTGGRLASAFSASDIEPWIWNSLQRGRPADDRFEELFPTQPSLAGYVTPLPPRSLHWGQHDVWQMLYRYQNRGIRPLTIVDVGASTGCWSQMASLIFPEAHFVLCEPLFHRYPQSARDWHVGQLASHEVVRKVVTNYCGNTSLTVSDTLYGSSLLAVGEVHGATSLVATECTTLDALHQQRQWKGPLLLKADVQFAEHLVLEGAAELLCEKTDAVLLELSFDRGHDEAKTYAEMVALLAAKGFEIFDESGGWRHPCTGQLEQKDVLFVKREPGQ
jgi:FkbM family methyltransferase